MKNRLKIYLVTLGVALAMLGMSVSSGSAKSKGLELVEGYRGMVLSVDPIQLTGIEPGDYVDVIVTFEAATKGEVREKVAATILQNVRVLDALPGRHAIRLMLNPNEAQYAALSMKQGDIDIVTRAEGDNEMKPMEMASFRKLFR